MKHASLGAPIVTFDEMERLKPKLGKIVMTSGGFDPVHPGHISCIMDSKQYGDTLIVVVNGDAFLRAKKGKPFQNLATRCMIISAIRQVDFVIPFEIEGDPTVSVALEKIRPAVFTKGGDRVDSKSIPEWDVCRRYGIGVISGVGLDKRWSSSDFLQQWIDHHNSLEA